MVLILQAMTSVVIIVVWIDRSINKLNRITRLAMQDFMITLATAIVSASVK